MAAGELSEPLRQVQTLFGAGSTSGLSERQLLERFARRRDEAAFAALVERHGPMVLATCRRMLRDAHDADDAFQATFLVLARRAGAIRDADRLGPWLHGVARRVSTRSRTLAARRGERDRRAARPEAWEAPEPDADRRDLRPVLDEELARLPEGHRAAIVLCHLEGLTHEEAARRLRCPVGTVRSRLARGRDRLRARLERRGVAPAAFALPSGAGAALGPSRVSSATRAAIDAASGQSTAGIVPAGVIQLAEEAMRIETIGRIAKWAAAVVLAATLVAAAALAAPGQGPAKGNEGAAVPEDLAKLVQGKVVRSLPVSKDDMILAYLPDQRVGHVDNLALANNDGGVRVLVDWERPSKEDLSSGRRFFLALYAREVKGQPSAGPILVFPLTADWPETVGWGARPAYADESIGQLTLEPKPGWKLIDVTEAVRLGEDGHGVMLRFRDEDRAGGRGKWCSYDFASREAAGDGAAKRPRLLVVEPR